jgi:hypothetical protein
MTIFGFCVLMITTWKSGGLRMPSALMVRLGRDRSESWSGGMLVAEVDLAGACSAVIRPEAVSGIRRHG